MNSVDDTYVSRIVSLNLHLDQMEGVNKYLARVRTHEQQNIVRQGIELQRAYEETADDPKTASRNIKMKIKGDHLKSWIAKAQHGFLFKTRERITDTDPVKTNFWLTKSSTTSHIEGYICAIQEEEINTRGLQKRRAKDDVDDRNKDYRCRVCHQETETIQHVLACCDRLRISLYLPIRHNAVASVLYHQLTKAEGKTIQTVFKNENIELWWDVKISTKPSLAHNKPDLLLWRLDEKRAFVIDVVVGLDVNVEKNYKAKLDNYLPLCVEMKKLYPEFSFEVVPIAIGATGLVMKKLSADLEKIGIEKAKVNKCIVLSQKAALFGSVKIVKSAMNY